MVTNLQSETQAQIGQLVSQIDLLNRNMSNVHGKIDMGLVANGANMNRDLMESKSIIGLSVFGGTDKESFREWAYKLTSVMERLKPGSREIMQKNRYHKGI